MLKVYYCPKCDRISYSHFNDVPCKCCDSKQIRFNIEYEDFVCLNLDERKDFVKKHLDNH